MSRPEIELLKEIYADWGRGDYTKTHYLHPDFVMVFGSDFLDEGEYTGLSEASEGWRAWLAQWSSWTSEATDYIEVGDRVLVPIRVEGEGKSTGMHLGADSANIWEFRDGLGYRVVLYTKEETARRELGLE